ncbi:putative secreted protein [Corynebacterium amycolatum]|nr:putative secreted protein [Corynebacterium amycolatum]
MSMNKSFRTLATTTAVALLTFGVAACGSSTVESSEVTSSTTTKTSTTSSSTKTSAPKSSEKSAPEITDPQAKRVDEAPDGQMKLSEADDSYLGALEKAGIDVAGVEDQLIGTGRAACADAPEEEREVIALAIAGQLVAQGRSQESAEEVAKTIASSAKKAYC